MSDPIQTIPGSAPSTRVRGPLVEDETVEGGYDAQGRAAIRPKQTTGAPPASDGFKPTDVRTIED